MGSLLVAIPLIVLAALVVLALAAMGIYNGLVRARNSYKNAFAQIDVQLKRRYDLIPNLVETAKAYLKHERETLEAVIAARQVASDARASAAAHPGEAGAMKGLAAAEGGLGAVMGRLFALSEAYPELRSNENMKQLQEELASTENKVAFARQAYNDAVMHYNNRRETFPSSIVAGAFKFPPATMFEVEGDAVAEPVKVDFAR
jgi:LemA protein